MRMRTTSRSLVVLLCNSWWTRNEVCRVFTVIMAFDGLFLSLISYVHSVNPP